MGEPGRRRGPATPTVAVPEQELVEPGQRPDGLGRRRRRTTLRHQVGLPGDPTRRPRRRRGAPPGGHRRWWPLPPGEVAHGGGPVPGDVAAGQPPPPRARDRVPTGPTRAAGQVYSGSRGGPETMGPYRRSRAVGTAAAAGGHAALENLQQSGPSRPRSGGAHQVGGPGEVVPGDQPHARARREGPRRPAASSASGRRWPPYQRAAHRPAAAPEARATTSTSRRRGQRQRPLHPWKMAWVASIRRPRQPRQTASPQTRCDEPVPPQPRSSPPPRPSPDARSHRTPGGR